MIMSNYINPGVEVNSPNNLAERAIDGAELERIQKFKDALSRYTLVSTISVDLEMDLGLPNPPAHAVNVFYSYKTGAPGLYLDKTAEELSRSRAVDILPRTARGGKNSAHGTFFGDLVFEDGQKKAVAVKPYQIQDANESVLKEYFNTRAVRKLGMYTLQPLGVFLGPNDNADAYFITELEEPLTTLDTIDWSAFYPNINDDPGMVQIWSQVARQLALFHSMGSNTHNDLAGRNIAINMDDYVFFIDWERSHISKLKPRDPEVSYHFSHSDLSMLLETFVRSPNDSFKSGLGILCGKTGDWWLAFKEIFLDEYIQTRLELVEGNNDKTNNKTNKTEIREVQEELDALVVSLHDDMLAAKQYNQMQY